MPHPHLPLRLPLPSPSQRPSLSLLPIQRPSLSLSPRPSPSLSPSLSPRRLHLHRQPPRSSARSRSSRSPRRSRDRLVARHPRGERQVPADDDELHVGGRGHDRPVEIDDLRRAEREPRGRPRRRRRVAVGPRQEAHADRVRVGDRIEAEREPRRTSTGLRPRPCSPSPRRRRRSTTRSPGSRRRSVRRPAPPAAAVVVGDAGAGSGEDAVVARAGRDVRREPCCHREAERRRETTGATCAAHASRFRARPE